MCSNACFAPLRSHRYHLTLQKGLLIQRTSNMKIPLYFILACVFVSMLPATEPVVKNGAGAQAAPRVARWEQTIKKFEALDDKTPPPHGAVLLVGGSNARRWADVDEYFPKHRIINRGFGGARPTEILHFADRIVLPYAPKVILLNAGGNDLSAGSSPTQIRETAGALIATVRANLPDTRIYFLGLPFVRRAIANSESRASISGMNEQLASLAEREAKVGFIDLVPAFLDNAGEFQPELFVEDGVHFSPKGYAVVTGLLRDKL